MITVSGRFNLEIVKRVVRMKFGRIPRPFRVCTVTSAVSGHFHELAGRSRSTYRFRMIQVALIFYYNKVARRIDGYMNYGNLDLLAPNMPALATLSVGRGKPSRLLRECKKL